MPTSSSPTFAQTLPPELVQPIVLHVIRDQLEDLFLLPSSPSVPRIYSSLALLHLCSVFRHCALSALGHIWGGLERNTVAYDHIFRFKAVDGSLSAAWDFEALPEKERFGVALARLQSLNENTSPRADAPIYSLLQTLALSRITQVAMRHLSKRPLRHHATAETQKMKSDIFSGSMSIAELLHTQNARCRDHIPAWLLKDVLGSLMPYSLGAAVYLVKMSAMEQASQVMSETLEELPSSVHLTHEQADQFADVIDQLAEDFYRSVTQMPLTEVNGLCRACGIDISPCEWTMEDARASGVASVLHEIRRRRKCRQLSSSAARRIQRSMRVSAGLTDAEAVLCGLPYEPSDNKAASRVGFAGELGPHVTPTH
ncbi:unnamed protein product [Peniophora sp. CBMAI 1063]|nr:unnamed protein product [Peniophora sp. CBMAI 1063]